MDKKEKVFYKKVGEIIKRWRHEYKGKLTQKDLAKMLNVSINTISRWETGIYAVSLHDLARLEDIFHNSLYLASFLHEDNYLNSNK